MKLQLDHLLIYVVIIFTYYVGLATANADAHIGNWSAFSRGALGVLFIISTLVFLLVCICNKAYDESIEKPIDGLKKELKKITQNLNRGTAE